MIGQLTGTVIECAPDHVLLDVAGVGYSLQIPLSTYYRVCGAHEAAICLHVHTHVREDALQLFGFSSREERGVFEMLIGISGVGPRMALAILSGIGADELHHAVRDQDRARLQQIPGVGKKTAERLLLELRDKMERGVVAPAAGARPGSGAGQPSAPSLRGDAASALMNLGYSRDAAERAVTRALDTLDGGDEAGLESLLKAALRQLVK